MAHLVDLHAASLSIDSPPNALPTDPWDLPRALLNAFVENTVTYYEALETITSRRKSYPAYSPGRSYTIADSAIVTSSRKLKQERLLRRRTLATIGTCFVFEKCLQGGPEVVIRRVTDS